VPFALLVGCGGDDDETTTNTSATPGAGQSTARPGVYVAQVEGTDASVALVTDGSRLSGAYLCIPKETSQWIQPAPFQGGKARLVARRGVSLGAARFRGKSAKGDVDVPGGSHSFNAQLASGKAGLYRTTSGTANQPGFSETGWIVLPEGSVCGSTNSITAGGGFASEPAPSSPEGRVTDFADPFPF
jgi:hypothetical protein